jgi:acetyltransferase-like isoleucine patch superfamily enzyme
VLNSNPEGYHAGMSFPVTLLADRPGANIIIGEGSRLHGCCVHAWSQIQIGRHCLLAAGSQVLDAHGHATEMEFARIRSRIQDMPAPIEIGDYCWLGLGALVLKGARLGEGCIVGAYSVVAAGEYPPFSLLAGSPAKVVRTVSAKDVYPEDYPVDQIAISGKKSYRY